MSSYSLHSRLHETEFDHLHPEQYLALMGVVADVTKPDEQRAQAKEDLLKAHFRLIAKLIRKFLNEFRANGEYRNLQRIGVEDRSDLFNSLAARMYAQMTDMAVSAPEGDFKLSSAITVRVTCRLMDKLRRSTAKKRKPNFNDSELLDTLSQSNDPLDALESLMLKEADQENRAAIAALHDNIAALPGNQGLVWQALAYGLETGQDLTITAIAKQLEISRTTAQSAYQAGKQKLQARFSDEDAGATE